MSAIHSKLGFLLAPMVLSGALLGWSPRASADSSIGLNVFLGSPPPVVVYPTPRVVYAEPIIVERYPVYHVHHYVGEPATVVVFSDNHGKKHWKHHWKHHGWRFDD